MREWMLPAQWLYLGATGLRNWMYDRRIFKPSSVDVPVISIGNLTVGGTGKTPVTLALLDQLATKGYRCGVVSRGYKRALTGVHEVTTDAKAALHFGDEPALIKFTYPEIPVVVGEKRADAARALVKQHQVDLILCDDAFQHRALHRDLNLVLFDATEKRDHYRPLPVGRARESVGPALRRADFLVMTKVNLAPQEDVAELSEWLKNKSDRPVLTAEYVLKGFIKTDGQVMKTLSDPAYLISAVAKPYTVENILKDKANVVKHKIFPDHHRYTFLDVEAMLDEASSLNARWLVTTQKDAVKLNRFSNLREKLLVMDLEVKFNGGLKAFYEAVDRIARPSH